MKSSWKEVKINWRKVFTGDGKFTQFSMLCHAEEMITPSISNALSAAALLCPISVGAQRILFVFKLTNYKKQPCRLNDAEYHNYCTIFIRKHSLITADRVYTHVHIYVSLHR